MISERKIEERGKVMEEGKAGIISLDDLRDAIDADFAQLKGTDEAQEKIECIIFFVCFLLGGALMILKVLVDLAPWICALPSAKVMFFRIFGRT